MAKLIVTGLKKLDRAIRTLEPRVSRKIVRRELRKGAKTIKDSIAARAPRDTGLLKRSIKVRAQKRSRRGIGVNAIMGEGFFKGETFYAAFQEFGAPGHMTYGKGRSPLPAKRFFRDGFNSSKHKVRQEVLTGILAGILREASKK